LLRVGRRKAPGKKKEADPIWRSSQKDPRDFLLIKKGGREKATAIAKEEGGVISRKNSAGKGAITTTKETDREQGQTKERDTRKETSLSERSHSVSGTSRQLKERSVRPGKKRALENSNERRSLAEKHSDIGISPQNQEMPGKRPKVLTYKSKKSQRGRNNYGREGEGERRRPDMVCNRGGFVHPNKR